MSVGTGTPPPRRLNPTPNLSPDMTADSPDHCVDRTNPSRAQVDLGATASANPKGVCASFVQRLMVSSVRSGKILPSGQPGPALRPPDFAGGSSQHPRELSPRAEPGFRWWRLSNSDPLAEVWLSARAAGLPTHRRGRRHLGPGDTRRRSRRPWCGSARESPWPEIGRWVGGGAGPTAIVHRRPGPWRPLVRPQKRK